MHAADLPQRSLRIPLGTRDAATLIRAFDPVRAVLGDGAALTIEEDCARLAVRGCDRTSLQIVLDWIAGAPAVAPLPQPPPDVGGTARTLDQWRRAHENTEPVRAPGAVAAASGQWAQCAVPLPASFAQRHGPDAEAVLVAAAALVVERGAQREGAVFAVRRDARPPGTEADVGTFETLAPVQVAAAAAGSLASLFDAARAALASAPRLDAAACELLVAAVASSRPSAPPFCVLVSVERPLRLEGAIIETEDAVPRVCDAALAVRGDALFLQHDPRTLHPVYAASLLRQIAMVLCADAHLSPLRVPLQSQLQQGQPAAVDFPRHLPAHALFEEWAAKTPGAIAVESSTGAISYAHLNASANRLAHALRGRGVTRGSRVALPAGRSAQTLTAILAILKCGAAYVPIDSAYPEARRAAMLEDARPSLVLDSAALNDLLAAGGSEANPPRSASGEDPAYVMYTSGSTGRPKGVVIPHRAIGRLVRGQDFAKMGADEVWLQLAPLAFDASTLEIWAPLANGGRLAIVEADHPSLDEIASAIERHRATSLWLTAGLFHLLVDRRLEALRPLRQLLAGGDVLRPDAVEKVRRAHPRLRLVNGYGPTENTTFTTCHVIGELDPDRPVPIGTPIANTTVQLLDASLTPVPLGAEGELYTGGDGLALGYLGAPELTAERFVETPFGRMYRTGDRARLLPDGALEFLGRRDGQVKVRGFRIELGEIETALALHPAVRAAAVDVRMTPAGDKVVVGYVVLRDGSAMPPLAEFLQPLLPAHLVPSGFVAVAELPLNTNGKVDRSSLPEWQPGQTQSEAPRSQLEQVVAGIWREVLQVERVGLRDNFFELGGNSLRLVEAHSRICEALKLEIPVVRLFQHPTVESLAASLGGGNSAAALAASVSARAARQRAVFQRRSGS